MTDERQVEFYFDFSCPYAYLASTQLPALAERTGAKLIYKPFLLGGVFKALGVEPNVMVAPRAALNMLDMRRYAELFSVPLVMPETHPNRTVLALRAALASSDLASASRALFAAYWQDGRDVSKPDVVEAALANAGLDGAGAVQQADAQRDELRRRTDEALERGVFGAPAMFVDGELFWGQDRLDQVERALGGSPEPVPTAAAGTVPVRLEFWFDYSSPFAYLGATQVAALAERTGAELVLEPFLLGALIHEIGTANVPLQTFAPAKQRYLARDMDRFAEQYSVPLNFPSRFPMRTLLPLRVTLAARQLELAAQLRLMDALFQAYWVDDQDLQSPETITAACNAAGVSTDLLNQAQSAPIKEALFEQTRRAKEHGLCGAPSYRVNDELFWGQDRLPLIERSILRASRP